MIVCGCAAKLPDAEVTYAGSSGFEGAGAALRIEGGIVEGIVA
jgi:hypothetical protein